MTMRIFMATIVAALAISLGPAVLAESPPEPESRRALPLSPRAWTDRAKTWSARSCVGEAGWYALDECVALAWVHAKRSRTTGIPYIKMIRRYSAATKPHQRHSRPWLLRLAVSGARPSGWPQQLRWGRYREAWEVLLERLDEWARGLHPDPLPDANHYGSGMDALLVKHRWYRVAAPSEFRNWFFDSRRRPGR
jgi:hypothetical protein